MGTAEREQGAHFERLDSLYWQLDEPPDVEGQRQKTFPDDSHLIMKRVESAAQNAYYASISHFRFYFSQKGLQWVHTPQVEFALGSEKFTAATRSPMEDVKGDQEAAALIIVDWLETSVKNNEIPPPPIEISFK